MGAHVVELAANHSADTQDVSKKSVDKFVDELVDRALNSWPLHRAELELDHATLAKTYRFKSRGTTDNRPLFPVPHFPFLASRSQFAIPEIRFLAEPVPHSS